MVYQQHRALGYGIECGYVHQAAGIGEVQVELLRNSIVVKRVLLRQERRVCSLGLQVDEAVLLDDVWGVDNDEVVSRDGHLPTPVAELLRGW